MPPLASAPLWTAVPLQVPSSSSPSLILQKFIQGQGHQAGTIGGSARQSAMKPVDMLIIIEQVKKWKIKLTVIEHVKKWKIKLTVVQ
jgi:hypothetical protein